MELQFLNPPVISSLEDRKVRAKKAIDIFRNIEKKSSSSKDDRWKFWIDMHNNISDVLTVDNLLIFQSHPVLGPSITGGSGRNFITMISERYGHRKLSLLLKNHTETLCGQPKDLVNEQGVNITITSMRHLYHLAKLHEICRNLCGSKIDFCEIGGGFGNLARIVLQYGLSDKYHIVDHPVMHAIQYYFLSEFLPESDIAVVSENGKFLTGGSRSRIHLHSSFMGDAALKGMMKEPFALVSTMAITETTRECQDRYLRLLSPALIYVFGQLRNVTVGGGKSAGEEAFDNDDLVFLLGSKFHTLEYKYHGYNFEYIGREKIRQNKRRSDGNKSKRSKS